MMADEVRKTDVNGAESVFQEIKPNGYNNILDETYCTSAAKAPAFFWQMSVLLYSRGKLEDEFQIYAANILLYLSARTLRC